MKMTKNAVPNKLLIQKYHKRYIILMNRTELNEEYIVHNHTPQVRPLQVGFSGALQMSK